MFSTLLIGLMLQSAPYATTLPTDVDLKATYCIAVLQIERRKFDSTDGDPMRRSIYAAAQASIDKSLQRLKVYMLPKMEYLEPMPLSAAYSQGQSAAANGSANQRECGEAKFLPF